MPRILLIGQGPTTETAFSSLVGRFDLIGVVRRAGPEDPVARLVTSAGVKLFLDPSVASVERLVSTLQPDAVVVSSYDRILRPALLSNCPFINVHYAPLPEYRGRATVNWALINGESHVAISIHELVPQLDGGQILFQQALPITQLDTVMTLYEKLNAIQRDALGPSVEAFLAGVPGRTQDHGRATYGCTRVPDDGEIDWGWPTEKIDRFIRALVAPFPGAFTHVHGRRLVVWQATPVADPPVYVGRIPGRVVGVSKAEGTVDVLTGDDVLRLLEVQCESDPRAVAASVITSVKTTLGLRAIELAAQVQRLEAHVAELTELVTSLREPTAGVEPRGDADDHGKAGAHNGWGGSDWVAHRRSAGR